MTSSILMALRGPNGEQLAVDDSGNFKWADQVGLSVTVEGAVGVLLKLIRENSSMVIPELARLGLGSIEEHLQTSGMVEKYDEYRRVLALYSAYCTRVGEPRSLVEWMEALACIQGEAENAAMLSEELERIKKKIDESGDVGKQQLKFWLRKQKEFGSPLVGATVEEVKQHLDCEESTRGDLHDVLSGGQTVEGTIQMMPVYTGSTPLSRVEWYADLLQRGETIEFTVVELMLYVYLVRISTGSVASVCVYGPDREPLPGSGHGPLDLQYTHSPDGATLTLSLFLNADHYDPLFLPGEVKVLEGGWTTVHSRGGGGHPQQPQQLRLLPVPPSGLVQAEQAAVAFMSRMEESPAWMHGVGDTDMRARIVVLFLSKLTPAELQPASHSFILTDFVMFDTALLTAYNEVLCEIDAMGVTKEGCTASGPEGATHDDVVEVNEEETDEEVRGVYDA